MEIPDYYWTDFELIENALLDRGSNLTVREIYEGWRDASKRHLGASWMYVPERAPELIYRIMEPYLLDRNYYKNKDKE